MFEQSVFTIDYFVRRQTTENWQIPTRTIANHELVYIANGDGEVCIENKKFKLKENTLVYFRPNSLHSIKTSNANPMQFYGLHFSFENNTQILPIEDIMILRNDVKLHNLFKDINTVHNQKKYMYKWHENILLTQILHEVLTYKNKSYSPTNELRIKNLIEYIHKAPYNQFTIEELCQKSNIKKSLLIKSFKEITGFTPIKYCNKLKLDYAKDLIINEKTFSLSMISSICGFNDLLYFSRSFKKYTGVSPSRFKNMCE